MIRYAWSEKKNRINNAKHGISFEAATAVFEDPLRKIEDDVWIGGEQRLRATGMLRNLTVAVVIHVSEDADAEEIIRIISARKATPGERRGYASISRER